MDLTLTVVPAPRHKYLVLGSKFCLVFVFVFFAVCIVTKLLLFFFLAVPVYCLSAQLLALLCDGFLLPFLSNLLKTEYIKLLAISFLILVTIECSVFCWCDRCISMEYLKLPLMTGAKLQSLDEA